MGIGKCTQKKVERNLKCNEELFIKKFFSKPTTTDAVTDVMINSKTDVMINSKTDVVCQKPM